MNIYEVVVEKRIYRYGQWHWEGDYAYWGTGKSMQDAIRKCRVKANKEFKYQYHIKVVRWVGKREF